jgi:hypothetical protein
MSIFLTWILIELWHFLNLDNSTLSRLLFYNQALRIVKHTVQATALVLKWDYIEGFLHDK